MIKRYPLARIGYSGHENPSNHNVSMIALSLGASVLERHIGKSDIDKNIEINKYSLESQRYY